MPEKSQLHATSGAKRKLRPEEVVIRPEPPRLLDHDAREFERLRHALSHDLRAPLRAMRSYAALLQRRYADRLDEKGCHFLERILGAGERAEDQLDELVAQVRERCLPVSITNSRPDGAPAAAEETSADDEDRQQEKAVMLLRHLQAMSSQRSAAGPSEDPAPGNRRQPPPRSRQ